MINPEELLYLTTRDIWRFINDSKLSDKTKMDVLNSLQDIRAAVARDKVDKEYSNLSLDAVTKEAKPVPIMFQFGTWFSGGVLDAILKANVINTVWISDLAFEDPPPSESSHLNFEKCANASKNTVLCRWLWPGYGQIDWDKDIFSPAFYADRLRRIFDEAESVGATYTAFDTEAYADCPMKTKGFTGDDLRRLSFAVNRGVDMAISAGYGRVDYVMPAGSRTPEHYYNVISGLGNHKVSEHTYYDRPGWDIIPYSYSVFGAAVGTKRENSEYPNLPLFTAESLLSRDDILSSFSDHGVFIYPWKTKDYSLEDVAQSFQMSLKDPKFAWLRNRNFLK